MVDETIPGPDGIKPPATPAPQKTAEPEATILEEVVIKKAKPAPLAAPAVLPPPAPVPAPPAPKPLPPPSPPAPTHPAQAPPISPPRVPPPQVPAPVPNIPIAPAAQKPPANDALADEVGLVLPHAQTPPPRPSPAPQSPALQEKPLNISKLPEGAPALGEDIAKILQGVKLPERRDPGLSTEQHTSPEVKTFDTALGKSAADTVQAPTQASPLQETVANPAQLASVVTPASPSLGGPQGAERGAGSIAAVHTLKNDLQDVVRDKKISVVKAVSLEEERRAHKSGSPVVEPGTAQRSKRTFGIIFSVLLLLGLGAAALFGVSIIMQQQNNQSSIEAGSSILFAEQSVLLSLDDQSPNDLKRALLAARSTSAGTLGSITRIIPVIGVTGPDAVVQNRPATFREFVEALGAHPPDELLRALGDDFFLGIHTVDKNAPMLIVPVVAHDRAFQAMLAWEEMLNADLSPAFTPLSALTKDENGLPLRRTYQDLVMRNYDVRALKDDSGTIQLFYSFPSQNILVIAESPYSFTEILSRLQAGRNL